MDAANPPAAVAERHWVSALLGALGILALGALVAAVVTVSHESSHPMGQSRPATPVTTAVPVNKSAPLPSPSAQPPTSWSATAVASTLASPPPAAPKREPSVRQRLHDMFPHLIPGH